MVGMTEGPMVRFSRALLPVSLLLLVLVTSPLVALAQDNKADFDPYPLRPADTSSPRDTLRSFLTNASKVIEDRRRGPDARSAAHFTAHDRALQT